MILTLKKMSVYETKPDGTPLRTKKGDQYWSVVLDTEEEGKLYNNIFNGDFLPSWKDGDKISVDLTQKGRYKNWDFAKGKNGNPYEADKHNAGVYNISQKNAPDENPPFPTEQVVNEEKRVFEDPTQERIIRGMCFNNACTLLGDKERYSTQEVLELSQSLYQEMADWLRNK